MFLAACAPAAAPPVVTDADRASILEQHAGFSSSLNSGDMAAVAAFYTEDALLMAPNAPRVTGRAAIEAFLKTFPPMDDLVLSGDEFAGGGDLIVVTGNFTINVMPPGATAAVADTGKFVEVWRRQPDGTLKMAADMWNSNLPLPPPPPPAKD
jgi:ketosteroid isomerase-like protein